mmetsp:Transcript_35861/g.81690  ORF Transcript_35861/g.81690 Transcript_35861/m.81690 type:complete len:92 (+) Transcript_35861:97-372(+)
MLAAAVRVITAASGASAAADAAADDAAADESESPPVSEWWVALWLAPVLFSSALALFLDCAVLLGVLLEWHFESDSESVLETDSESTLGDS